MSSQAKKDFEARMAQQEEARQQRIAAKQQQNEENLTDPTQTATFLQTFTTMQKEIEEKIEAMKKEQVVEGMDGCWVTLNSMTTVLRNVASFLPAYETRHAQQQIDSLSNQLTQLQSAIAPKKKFAFSKKKTTTPATTSTVIDSTPTPTNSDNVNTNTSVNTKDLYSNHEGTTLNFPGQNTSTEPQQQFVSPNFTMSNLKNCNISVRMTGLKDCKVVLGPVRGSVFIDNCDNCQFTIASQQQRIHNTTKTKFYTACASYPIIETCTELLFGSYNVQYPNRDAHFKETGIDIASPTSQVVKDFDWQKQGVASPNWSIMDVSLCSPVLYDQISSP